MVRRGTFEFVSTYHGRQSRVSAPIASQGGGRREWLDRLSLPDVLLRLSDPWCRFRSVLVRLGSETPERAVKLTFGVLRIEEYSVV